MCIRDRHVDMPVHADVKDLLNVMDEVLSEEGKADGAASMTQEYKDAQAEWPVSYTHLCLLWCLSLVRRFGFRIQRDRRINHVSGNQDLPLWIV